MWNFIASPFCREQPAADENNRGKSMQSKRIKNVTQDKINSFKSLVTRQKILPGRLEKEFLDLSIGSCLKGEKQLCHRNI